MIRAFIIIQTIAIFIFTFMLICEKIARRKPDSAFAKWWRANVIGDDIYNERE